MQAKQFVEVMIDIETTGTEPGCGIWQIGAVADVPVDLPDGDFGLAFVHTINPYTLDGHQDAWDPETIAWQETTNKEHWDNAMSYDGTVAEAPQLMMTAFFSWCRDIKAIADTVGSEVRYWCKGTSFDFPIIERFNRNLGGQKILIPWRYGQCNDLRTMCNVLGQPVPKFPGAHNALVDAQKQMYHLINLLYLIGAKG